MLYYYLVCPHLIWSTFILWKQSWLDSTLLLEWAKNQTATSGIKQPHKKWHLTTHPIPLLESHHPCQENHFWFVERRLRWKDSKHKEFESLCRASEANRRVHGDWAPTCKYNIKTRWRDENVVCTVICFWRICNGWGKNLRHQTRGLRKKIILSVAQLWSSDEPSTQCEWSDGCPPPPSRLP